MNKIINAFLILVITSIIACDEIDPPYEETPTPGPVDTLPVHKVLLEDFTGHTCGNCPYAAQEALNIANAPKYAGKIVIVSTHIGFFAEPANSGLFTYDFRTQAGNEIDQQFQIDARGLPKGMINRNNFTFPDPILNYTSWSTAVDSAVKMPADLKIEIEKEYNENTRALNATINLTYYNEGNKDHQLVVYLLEDSIVKPQRFYNPDRDEPSFVHRHVLRGAFNSSLGDPLTVNAIIQPGTKFSKSYVKTLNADWDEKHCSIVAFVHDIQTKKVLQVEELHVY